MYGGLYALGGTNSVRSPDAAVTSSKSRLSSIGLKAVLRTQYELRSRSVRVGGSLPLPHYRLAHLGQHVGSKPSSPFVVPVLTGICGFVAASIPPKGQYCSNENDD